MFGLWKKNQTVMFGIQSIDKYDVIPKVLYLDKDKLNLFCFKRTCIAKTDGLEKLLRLISAFIYMIDYSFSVLSTED